MIPENTTCPECGESPTEQSVARIKLSDLGYHHEDVFLHCGECDTQWTCGVPHGSSDEHSSDLRCSSCDQGWMLVHRVKRLTDGVRLHMKCPNCYYFTTTERPSDRDEISLVGYPQITGDTENCKPYGY